MVARRIAVSMDHPKVRCMTLGSEKLVIDADLNADLEAVERVRERLLKLRCEHDLARFEYTPCPDRPD